MISVKTSLLRGGWLFLKFYYGEKSQFIQKSLSANLAYNPSLFCFWDNFDA
jgi:hypothetical protein